MLKPALSWVSTSLIVFLLCVDAGRADEERAARQAELDRACEAARQEKLAPIRQAFIDDCVNEGQFDTREECEAFYADYGNRSGNRAALFFDLPPCVEAFEYAQSERSSG